MMSMQMKIQTEIIESVKGSGVNVPIGVMLARVWYTLHCPGALCSLAHLTGSSSIKTNATRTLFPARLPTATAS